MDAAAAARMRLTWLAVAFATALTLPLIKIGADARWLAAMGRAIVRTASVPGHIPYAAAPSHHWADVPVLAEIIFHSLEVTLGDRGLLIAQLAAVVLALALLALDMRAAGTADAPRAVVLLSVPLAAAPAFVVARSQLFSLALFPLLLLLLRGEERKPSRRIWLLVPLLAIWSNLHGAVLVGLAVASIYLVVERLRRQPWLGAAVLVASIGAIFLTPPLLQTAKYYAGVLHGEAAKTGEGMWAPLSPHHFFDVVFVIVALPLAVLAVRARPAVWELVCMAVLAAAAIHASRNAVWFVLFVATPAARQLGRTRLARFVPHLRVAALSYCGPLLLVIAGLGQTPPPSAVSEPLLSTAIKVAKGKPILADDLVAEQLALHGQRVWIANPLDAFSASEQRAYLAWLHGAPAGDRLRNRVGRTILVTRGTTPDKRLRADSDYRAIAHDRVAVLYVRRAST